MLPSNDNSLFLYSPAIWLFHLFNEGYSWGFCDLLVLFNIINLLINDSALDSEGYLFCGFQLQVNLPLLYTGSIGFYVLINHITITPFREGFTFTLMVIPIEIASFLKEKKSSWNMDYCDQNMANWMFGGGYGVAMAWVVVVVVVGGDGGGGGGGGGWDHLSNAWF